MPNKTILTALLFSFTLSAVAAAENTSDSVVATIGDTKLTLSDLEKGMEKDFHEVEMALFELRLHSFQNKVIDYFVRKDPKSKGMTTDQFLDSYVFNDIKVTDKQIDELIKNNEIPEDKITPKLKEKAGRFLESSLKDDALQRWMQKQQATTPVTFSLRPPKPPVFDIDTTNSPYWGNPEAKVVLIEASDFQCPYCAKAAKTVDQLKEKYKDQIKIVFKQFPLISIHPLAQTAAEASLCANQQGQDQFWNYHDKIFAKQSSLKKEDFEQFAKEIGLDQNRFMACLSKNEMAPQVEKDLKDWNAIGINSTPTFFINGKQVTGELTLPALSALIDGALK